MKSEPPTKLADMTELWTCPWLLTWWLTFHLFFLGRKDLVSGGGGLEYKKGRGARRLA